MLANHPYFLSVTIDRDIDVDVAVRLSGVPLDEFKTLNPQDFGLALPVLANHCISCTSTIRSNYSIIT